VLVLQAKMLYMDITEPGAVTPVLSAAQEVVVAVVPLRLSQLARVPSWQQEAVVPVEVTTFVATPTLILDRAT
jgi:hypothetical protein